MSRTEPSASETASSIVPVSNLISRNGTIPFVGLTPAGSGSYPDPVLAVGDRFASDTSEALSFQEATQVLPEAGEGDLWADNEFVDPVGGGEVQVDTDAIRNVHGLDIDTLESQTGHSLEQLAAVASPDPIIPVNDHKDIIDRRRLALRALGYDVKFRWQIATDSYTPGDMHRLFDEKIAACTQDEYDVGTPFGWIHYYDWGGSAKITVIYPGMDHEVGVASDARLPDGILTDEESILAPAENPIEQTGENMADTEDEAITVYYGDRMGFDFRGTQTIWTYPVYYTPATGAMVPLSSPRFTRRHVGDLMNDAHERDNDRTPLNEWFGKVLNKLSTLATDINEDIAKTRKIAIDFGELPFDVEAFYVYLGIPEDYAEHAAGRATALAAPDHKPSLWNLQFSLKLALLEEFQGDQAGDRYQELSELAGQILRYPGQQIRTAVKNYRLEVDGDDDDDDDDGETSVPEDQQTLPESLEEVLDFTVAKSEDDLDDAETQQLENTIQRRLSDL